MVGGGYPHIRCKYMSFNNYYCMDIFSTPKSTPGSTCCARYMHDTVPRVSKSIYDDEYRHLMSLLREARTSSGLTQQDVAERLSRPQSFVAKIEGCERRLDIVEFIHLCRAIGIEPTRVLGGVLYAWQQGVLPFRQQDRGPYLVVSH